jgi:hypothetical protein
VAGVSPPHVREPSYMRLFETPDTHGEPEYELSAISRCAAGHAISSRGRRFFIAYRR